ncbi:MAG: ABC transporter permease [Cumulibacter sp.]
MRTTGKVTTGKPASNASAPRPVARTRGMSSLARAELTMLLRNRTALVNTILVPLALVAALYMIGQDSDLGSPTTVMVTSAVVLAMSYVVYYNLVTTYVARRESYVLKRMRTGTVPDYGILFATALPSLVLAVLQIIVVAIGAVVIGPVPGFQNVVAVMLAMVLGFAVFMMLAAASVPFTKTAETAQVTTLPVVLITMGLSGMFFPLHVLPDSLGNIARLTPGASVVELLNIGMQGIDRNGEAIVSFADGVARCLTPTVVLLAWVVVTGWIIKERFTWEPRR